MSLKKPSELFGVQQPSSSKVNADEDFSRIKEELGKVDNLRDQLDQVTNSLSGTLTQVIDKNFKSIDDYSEVLEGFNNKIESFRKEIIYKVDEIEKSSQVLEGKVQGVLREYVDSNTNLKDKVRKELSNVRSEVVLFKKKQDDLIETVDTHTQEQNKVTEEQSKLIETLEENQNKLTETIDTDTKELSKELSIVKTESVIFDTKINNLKDIKEEVLSEVKDILSGDVSDNIKRLEEKIEYIRDTYKTVDLQEGLLNIVPDETTSDPLTPLDQQYVTPQQLQDHYRLFLNRIQQQLATIGGGGAVNIRDLDDVDVASAKVNGKFLKYDSSVDKWVGAAGGGGGGSYTGTVGQLLQHDGSDYVGVSSVGLATYFNDYHQGYYRYSTHYYSAGIANTVQTLPADQFVMIQPSVRSNKVQYLPKKMLNANSNDPWVGTGASVGTGQTEFSLAGLDEGSTVVVRIASQFNPDIDNTNLDFALNFTTNPSTQAAGSTNFSITREQALICNEGADQNYISETLMNFYVGSSLSGLTTQTAGTFNISARASDEGDLEMMALTINVVA